MLPGLKHDKALKINNIVFLCKILGFELMPNYAPMGFGFGCKCLVFRVFGGCGCGMGGTTFGVFAPPKALIVNTVSASFFWNRAPIAPQSHHEKYD